MEKELKKTYRISKRAEEVIQRVKEERGLKSEAAALEFILKDYENRKSTVDDFVRNFNEANKAYMERLRWATQTSEQNTQVILDILNTFLFLYDPRDKDVYVCMTTDNIQHPFIEESKASIKEKISHYKQVKDNNKRKAKEEDGYV